MPPDPVSNPVSNPASGDGTIEGQPDLPVIQAHSDVDDDDLRGGRISTHVTLQPAQVPASAPVTVAEPYVAATSAVADSATVQIAPADSTASSEYDQTGHDTQADADVRAKAEADAQAAQDQEKHDQEQATADHDAAQAVETHDVSAVADNSAEISHVDDPVSGHDAPTDQSTETS